MQLLGPWNLYVFDDSSEESQTIAALRKAAAEGVTVIWSRGDTRVSVLFYPNASSVQHFRGIPTMSESRPDVHMARRRKDCFEVLGKRIWKLFPDVYIVPLDVDEVRGCLGPSPFSDADDQDGGWQIRFDQHEVLDAFSECRRQDQIHEGRPGYYAMHGLIARLRNEILLEEGGTRVRLARVSVVDPFDVHGLLERVDANSGERTVDKKFVRAGNWKAHGVGGHDLHTRHNAEWVFSRVVLVSYGTMQTRAQLREKLEKRFVQTGWHERLNLSLEQVLNISSHIDLAECQGQSNHYCRDLVNLHRGNMRFPRCDDDLASRGITIFPSPPA